MKQIFFITLWYMFTSVVAVADINQENKTPPLMVGIKHSPPFVIKQENGEWSGMSVDLWRRIATELNFEFKFQEKDLAGLLDGLKSGELDVAVGALTVTAERLQFMDFSHPFYSSGLSIAVPSRPDNAWLNMIRAFFTWQFFSAIAGLLILLLIIGILVWFFEHRRNQQFGGNLSRGIGSGLWWSAVTMTTVGYGDKAPVTLGGRFVALIWMFASIIVISGFTAAITSSLTVGQLANGIAGPQDLFNVRTGTITGTSSESYMQSRFIGYHGFENVDQGLYALATGEIEAFVYDQPLLQYLTKSKYQGQVNVLPNSFLRQDYAFGLVETSKLKEKIDRQLLQQLESTHWQSQLKRYLGIDTEM